MSVLECSRVIREKTEEGGDDHGLFQPALEGKRPARWLKNERTLQYYDLQQNDEVEYKKKHRPLKVKLKDDTVKTVLIDDTLTVSEIAKVIGEKLSVGNGEEFSLKIPEKSEWLNPTLPLHEQGISDDTLLLYKKKFFVSDANVSTEDPITLHYIYIESRDAILEGSNPCTIEEACQFAAMQCQVVLGSYDANKEKKIDFKDFLPPQHQKNAKKLEEKIVREYKKLVGMSEVNAKYRYVQLCRSLKTYGITFFEVQRKTKGNQKKAKPIYLGITRSSVLFMDYETKDITNEYALTKLRRWASSPSSFTLDFGDHEGDYVVLLTQQSESISQLLAGYIDILLAKRKEPSTFVDSNDRDIAREESVTPIKSQALSSISMSTIGMGGDAYGGYEQILGNGRQGIARGPSMPAIPHSAVPTNLASSISYVANLIGNMGQGQQVFVRNTALSPSEWRSQMIANVDSLQSSVASLTGKQHDKFLMDNKAAEIASHLAALISAARNAAFKPNGDEDLDLLDGAKRVLMPSEIYWEHPKTSRNTQTTQLLWTNSIRLSELCKLLPLCSLQQARER